METIADNGQEVMSKQEKKLLLALLMLYDDFVDVLPCSETNMTNMEHLSERRNSVHKICIDIRSILVKLEKLETGKYPDFSFVIQSITAMPDMTNSSITGRISLFAMYNMIKTELGNMLNHCLSDDKQITVLTPITINAATSIVH